MDNSIYCHCASLSAGEDSIAQSFKKILINKGALTKHKKTIAMVNAIVRPTAIPIPILVASERPSGMSGLSVPISSTLLTCCDSGYSVSTFKCRSGVIMTITRVGRRVSNEKVGDACPLVILS